MPTRNHLPIAVIRRTIGRSLATIGLKETATVVYRKWFKDRAYQRWISHVESRQSRPKPLQTPLISVIVPCHKYVGRYFLEMLGSVQSQTYQNWELVIVNACDNNEDAKKISNAIQSDKRVKQVRLDKNLHISANTNAGITAARGVYLAFLDYDDILSHSALADVASAIAANPELDAFYSDEDKLSDRGNLRYYPFFKPSFNEEQFLTSNFVTHFTVMRTSLVNELGGLRLGFEGSQDYDLWLRIYEKTSSIARIPRMSYHWRVAEGSTAGVVSSKNYASAAGKKALREHLQRRGVVAKVSDFPGQPSTYRVCYDLPGIVKLIVVAEMDCFNDDLTAELKHFPYMRISPADWAAQLPKPSKYTHVLFLSAPSHAMTPGWLRELIGKSSQPSVGLVSAQVLNQSGLSRAGYVAQQGVLEAVYGDCREDVFLHDGLNNIPKPYVAVGRECAVVSAAVLSTIWTDGHPAPDWFELCLAINDQGYRNVCWTSARVTQDITNDKWLEPVRLLSSPTAGDPYINPSLSVHEGMAKPSLQTRS